MNRVVDVVAVGEAQGGVNLILRIMAGDHQAEAELVKRYNRGIAFIIRREVGDAAAADDLHQETFLGTCTGP